jgi:hypothetical protein
METTKQPAASQEKKVVYRFTDRDRRQQRNIFIQFFRFMSLTLHFVKLVKIK